MPIALLLAMQAAGMVIDYLGTRQQAQFAEYGAKIYQAGLEANIYQTRLETEDASLQAIKNLRQNMGSQIAVMAARGTSMAGGNPVALLSESVNNFNSDERVRRLNQMGKEGQLRSGKAISMLQSQSETSKLWQGFSSRSINKFSSSGYSSGSSAGTSAYGMTNISSGSNWAQGIK